MAFPHVRAGDLNRLVTIQQRGTSRDAFGQQVTTWTDVVKTLAMIEPLSGRELQLAQAVNSETSHRVTIRYRSGLAAAMRLVYQGRFFNILSVIDVEMAHMTIQMMCAEGLTDG